MCKIKTLAEYYDEKCTHPQSGYAIQWWNGLPYCEKEIYRWKYNVIDVRPNIDSILMMYLNVFK